MQSRLEQQPFDPRPRLLGRHLRLGWMCLLGFSALGVALELLHAVKSPWYVGAAGETRRLMLTLGHAHGVLLGLVNVAFAVSAHVAAPTVAARLSSASALLRWSTGLLPAGFVAGGVLVWSGDPGPGILLAPIGAAALLCALLQTTRAFAARASPEPPGVKAAWHRRA